MGSLNGSRFTDKTRKYGLARLEGQSPRAAAKTAGYVPDARTIAKLETNIKSILAQCAEAQDITPEYLVKKLKEGLEATTFRVFLNKEGEIVDKEYVDYATRHKYLDLALKLFDLYPQRGQTAAPASVQMNVLEVVQQFGHLSNEEITEKMQQMRAGLLAGLTGGENVERARQSEGEGE